MENLVKIMNRPCDKCGKSDKPVYEHYTTSQSESIQFIIEGNKKFNRITSSGIQFNCKECYEKSRIKM